MTRPFPHEIIKHNIYKEKNITKGSRPTAGHHRVAFGVGGSGFLQFLSRLDEIVVYNQQNERLTRQHIVDHDLAWSIYFCDPYGHLYEITTYYYDFVQQNL